jgi:hypothetical protein
LRGAQAASELARAGTIELQGSLEEFLDELLISSQLIINTPDYTPDKFTVNIFL